MCMRLGLSLLIMLVRHLPHLLHLVLIIWIWSALRSDVIDNIGQRSPRSLQSKVDEIRVFRGEIIDNVGQWSPRTETNPRIPEIGIGTLFIRAKVVNLLIALLNVVNWVWNSSFGQFWFFILSTHVQILNLRFSNQVEILLVLDSIPSRRDCKRVPGPAKGDSSIKPEIDKLGLDSALSGGA